MNANLFVTLLTQLLPLIAKAGVSEQVQAVINTLVQLLPDIIQEAEDLYQPISNIIAELSGNASVTTAQLDQLQSLQASMDKAYEAAAAAAGDPDTDPTDTAANPPSAASTPVADAPAASGEPVVPAASDATAPSSAPVDPAAPPVAPEPPATT